MILVFNVVGFRTLYIHSSGENSYEDSRKAAMKQLKAYTDSSQPQASATTRRWSLKWMCSSVNARNPRLLVHQQHNRARRNSMRLDEVCAYELLGIGHEILSDALGNLADTAK